MFVPHLCDRTMPPILRSTIHLTPPETVRRVQARLEAQEATLSQVKPRQAHPNLTQCSLLHKLRRAKGKAIPPSNRRGQKKRAALTAMNRDVRLIYIMEAVEEIRAAKEAERTFIKDFRKGSLRKEEYSPKAPRTRRKVVARDVIVWLQAKKLGNFCLRTVTADLHFLKKEATYMF